MLHIKRKCTLLNTNFSIVHFYLHLLWHIHLKALEQYVAENLERGVIDQFEKVSKIDDF